MDNIDEKVKLKKEIINNQFLNEDKKHNIKQIMKNEYEKDDNTSKKTNRILMWKKVLTIAACVIVISSATMAGNIGDFITNIFKNTEMDTDQIIKPENIIEINSEYVTCNGIGLNVGYVYEDDDYLYIAMNIRGGDDAEDIFFREVIVNDYENNITYSDENTLRKNYLGSTQYRKEFNMVFIKLLKNNSIKEIRKLELKINNILIKKPNSREEYIEGEWIFKIERS